MVFRKLHDIVFLYSDGCIQIIDHTVSTGRQTLGCIRQLLTASDSTLTAFTLELLLDSKTIGPAGTHRAHLSISARSCSLGSMSESFSFIRSRHQIHVTNFSLEFPETLPAEWSSWSDLGKFRTSILFYCELR